MEKYKSDLIKPENLKIEVGHYEKDNIKFQRVKLTIIDSGISETVSSEKGQVFIYNECLKQLEKKYLLDKIDTYDIALDMVKNERDFYKERVKIFEDVIKKQIQAFEGTPLFNDGTHRLIVNKNTLIKLKKILYGEEYEIIEKFNQEMR